MFTVTIGATGGVAQSVVDTIAALVQEAANIWARYIDFGSAELTIELAFDSLGGTTLASGGSDFFFLTSGEFSGFFQATSVLELQDGVDRNGPGNADLFLTIDTVTLNDGEFFLGGEGDPGVPGNQFDLLSIILHELAHGLGFLGFGEGPDGDQSVFDSFVTDEGASGLFFNGAETIAVAGGPLRLADDSHVDNSADLLNDTIGRGDRQPISVLDLAVFQDIGVPLLGPTNGDDFLYGLESTTLAPGFISGLDVVELLDGDDTYFGLSGDDTISGQAGDDSLYGGSGRDDIFGGEGNDLLVGGSEWDELHGGDGDDIIYTEEEGIINTVGTSDLVYGGAGADSIFGGASRIEGGAGNDLINTGLAGAASIFGEDGDDTIISTRPGNTVNGGDGVDTFIYIDNQFTPNDAGLIVNLSGTTASPLNGGQLVSGNTFLEGGSGSLIAAIENFTASNGRDAVYGTNSVNVIDGGNGDDEILGFGGNDRIIGGAGEDALEGGDGDDVFVGGAPGGVLDGGDAINGGSGVDTVDFSASTTAVGLNLTDGVGNLGDARDDTYISIENIIGSAFSDFLVADANANRIEGGDGDDLIQSGGGNDLNFGGAGVDDIRAGFGDDLLNGGAGADLLNGGDGSDTADYTGATGRVALELYLGAGRVGDADGDQYTSIENVIGTGFGDYIVGSSVANVLSGAAGFDTLIGGGGDDVLNGGFGQDILDGGAGFDTASYRDATAQISITLFNQTGLAGEAVGDTFISIENIEGSRFGDFIAGDAGANDISGLDGNDILFGGGGADALRGGNGSDLLRGDGGGDLLDGGAGVDTIDYSKAQSRVALELYLNAGRIGDAAGDTFVSIENVIGTNFNDFVVGDAFANRIEGGGDNDVIQAAGGDDVIVGGLGNDGLTGGSGLDTFIYATGDGADRIFDFAAGVGAGDVLDLSTGAAFDTFEEVLAATSDVNGAAVIDFGNGDSIELVGVAKADLDADDFTFPGQQVAASGSLSNAGAKSVSSNGLSEDTDATDVLENQASTDAPLETPESALLNDEPLITVDLSSARRATCACAACCGDEHSTAKHIDLPGDEALVRVSDQFNGLDPLSDDSLLTMDDHGQLY